MLLIWVEDASGVRLGSGPITSATGWRHREELNRAGSFSFTMPAADPKASLVQAFRWVRAWVADANGLRMVGRGRIIRRQRTIGPDGAPMLEVSGPDQVDELADRIVRRAELHDERQLHPCDVLFGETRATLVLDLQPGDTSTWSTNTYGQGVTVRHREKFSSVYIMVHTAQTHDSGGSAYYSTASGRRPLTVLEETHSSAAQNGSRIWFAHDGFVRFEPPSDWEPPEGEFYYEIYFDGPNPAGFSQGWAWSDVWIGGVLAPTAHALEQILAYTPGWSLDAANGYASTQPRPLSGVELLENGGFETHTGTADDATTDSWTGWTNAYINDGQGDSALASTTAHNGGHAVKLAHGAVANWAGIRQDVTVLPGTVYTLSFWTRGDGTGQLAYLIFDTPNNVRLTETVDCGVTGTSWVQVKRTITTTPVTTQLSVWFFAPIANNSAAWVDDVSLQAGGDDAVFLRMAEESALESLVRVTEITGEKFTSGVMDRELLWLGRDARPSGLRAIGHADPLAVRAADNMLVILDADETEDADDLVSRVYVYGAGSGTSRLQPYWATLDPPDGYVLDRTNGYVERSAAVAAIGVIECSQQWDDIVPMAGNIANDQARTQAANQLVMQAVTYLEQHSCTDVNPETGDVPKFYRLRIAGARRDIKAGYTITVRYSHWRDGVRAWAIDGELWVTSVEREVQADGTTVVVGLDVATVPRQPMSPREYQLRELRRMRGLRGHTVSEGC